MPVGFGHCWGRMMTIAVKQKGESMAEYIVSETVHPLGGTQQEVIGELIRCKNCKFWMPHSQFGYDEDNETYHDYCAKLVPEDEYYAFYRNADDYCSRAERKTDVDANT